MDICESHALDLEQNKNWQKKTVYDSVHWKQNIQFESLPRLLRPIYHFNFICKGWLLLSPQITPFLFLSKLIPIQLIISRWMEFKFEIAVLENRKRLWMQFLVQIFVHLKNIQRTREREYRVWEYRRIHQGYLVVWYPNPTKSRSQSSSRKDSYLVVPPGPPQRYLDLIFLTPSSFLWPISLVFYSQLWNFLIQCLMGNVQEGLGLKRKM